MLHPSGCGFCFQERNCPFDKGHLSSQSCPRKVIIGGMGPADWRDLFMLDITAK